ncbi:hypothetical protein [Sphingomonas oryzagri]|uniref:Uncharacterized protein n=1 Tax=Sphingomonas oryzagri TaxID=3042314 RepID=A0ABT6MX97_9SPHN|nr:hypothetical protein [Sphingomonas oryzagri]MDH7637659.1 hypothetical protein [Sphingomonas oryzagri]
MGHGFAIQPPRAAYVHLDELRLLHLIADAQVGTIDDGMPQPLRSIITDAAAALCAFGVALHADAERLS